MATVERYAIENSQFLASRGIKMLVVACNTASALALPKIRESIGLDVVGVIGPGGRKAVELTKEKANPRIGVIATEATVLSDAYGRALRRRRPELEIVSRACPLLVPLVEEGWLDDPVTEAVARRYLAPLLAAEIDTLVLGCTHYPLLVPLLERLVGARVALVDSAAAVAEQVERELPRRRLEATGDVRREDHFCVTDGSARFGRLAREILAREVPLELVDVGAGEGR